MILLLDNCLVTWWSAINDDSIVATDVQSWLNTAPLCAICVHVQRDLRFKYIDLSLSLSYAGGALSEAYFSRRDPGCTTIISLV